MATKAVATSWSVIWACRAIRKTVMPWKRALAQMRTISGQRIEQVFLDRVRDQADSVIYICGRKRVVAAPFPMT